MLKSEARKPKSETRRACWRLDLFGFRSSDFLRISVFWQILTDFPGRAGGCPPAPPQSRTSPIKAYGSSGGTASLHSRRYPWGSVHRHSDLRVSGRLPPHGSVCPRPLPSLLPGCLGLVHRLSIGTMKRLRLPPRFFPRSVRHIATQYPGLAWRFHSWRRASPLPQGLEVVKPVPPSRRFVPRTRTGLPCSQGTPMCLCPALRPRPDLGAWPSRRSGIAPVALTTKAPASGYFEAQSHGFSTGCLRFVPPLSGDYAKLASGGWQTFPGSDSNVPAEFL